ncbi:MAG: guanylate kinase [Methylobacteriaceae bacterium]|jgi:guanylate kinase|uniref:Guanylate kinase n=5 Tax=Methylorubrum extorquens TaxID=408 RepID=C5B2D3_METEA|nr:MULTISPECIES: guanylate kinase [Methylobacteriaceae]KQO78537.1 guanylate kinase [Methylobacterium sp. Leaf90]KQO88981.1 guanylate kinase [Methylobacterium sp. Leaf92]KQP89189.1 guanylate kinase [Methylobacterium sp. Leaf119]KQQ00454.1 guanylate kinase [Methylobacterium sp. Leaf121]MBA9069297.1 guanylate kinase [Methylobacterium sp. RAS18]MDF9865766.1 guanylate kinase [Methylorubrum pseudosasae]MDH6639328.1 guanylate kinase [Methylobacterium sp. SuP10 SLI 274]
MTQDATQGRPDIARRGLILILSSPSGAGKTTLTRAIAQRPEWGLDLSISVTTRSRRPSEIDGRDYRFIDREAFEDLRTRDDLLEWAEVHGNFYGTPRRPVEKTLSQGRDMIFDIDYQGTRQVRQRLQDDVVTVFILPPSFAELRNRLERRAEDAPETIERRLANARNEMQRWSEYDYVIVNDDLDESFRALQSILAAERLKRTRRTGLPGFVDGLLAEAGRSA